MRNPSPYNLFTDLSPGLFTHVGVVAAETGKDGIRRLVLVDLPERGTTMPATNVDAFVNRSLHYMFLRHPDPAVAKKMGDTAAAVIGAPTEFDLNFRTDHVTGRLKAANRWRARRSTPTARLSAAMCSRHGPATRRVLPNRRGPGRRQHTRKPGEDRNHVRRQLHIADRGPVLDQVANRRPARADVRFSARS